MTLLNQYKKTRIAPTPSGFLHLGNILSFAITALLARRSGAKILLRIDDMDQARAAKHYIWDIFDTLNFLEIPWDEGPRDAAEFERHYSQLHRRDLYRQALNQLAGGQRVFACTCSRKQLLDSGSCVCMDKKIPLSTENACWRLITQNNRQLFIKNYSGETILAGIPADMEQFIVKKKDGFPAYQLTSVIDDLFYGTDLVIRGADLWPSSVAQHELALALGESRFGDIAFYHHSLLMETPGKKLSKSAGATSVKHLRESGKTASEIYTLTAAMLGVNHPVINWQQLAEIALDKNDGLF